MNFQSSRPQQKKAQHHPQDVKPRRDQPRVRGGEVVAGAIVTSLEARLQKKIDSELPLIVTASKAGVKEKLRNLLRSMPGESLFPCEAECCYDGGSDHLRPKTMNRREFLTWARRAALAAPAAVLGYGLFEASWFHVARHTIAIPNLPAAFDGLTIALLTDLHHGRFTSLHYIRTIVEVTNAQQADIIALGGDYAHAHRRYIPPCLEMLAELKARLGVFGVLGNHDHWYDARLTRECMRRSHIADLTNTGYWLLRGTSRLRIGGVDDFWEGAQELSAALGDASADETCILLSHNPDYVETISDRRVGLVLSGHTHGGQIVLPGVGAPYVPSMYGQKYLHGLVRTAYTQVYVSRGLATIGPPVRLGARPEISLIRLTTPTSGISLPA